MEVYKYKNLNVVKCHGVELRGLKASLAPRRQQTQASPKLEEYIFTPYFDDKSQQTLETPMGNALRVCIDLVIENTQALKLKVIEISQKAENSLATEVHNIALSQPMYQDDVTILTLKAQAGKLEDVKKVGIKIIAKDSLEKLVPDQGNHLAVTDEEKLIQVASTSIKGTGFVLLHLPFGNITSVISEELNLVAHKVSKDREFFLLRKV